MTGLFNPPPAQKRQVFKVEATREPPNGEWTAVRLQPAPVLKAVGKTAAAALRGLADELERHG